MKATPENQPNGLRNHSECNAVSRVLLAWAVPFMLVTGLRAAADTADLTYTLLDGRAVQMTLEGNQSGNLFTVTGLSRVEFDGMEYPTALFPFLVSADSFVPIEIPGPPELTLDGTFMDFVADSAMLEYAVVFSVNNGTSDFAGFDYVMIGSVMSGRTSPLMETFDAGAYELRVTLAGSQIPEGSGFVAGGLVVGLAAWAGGRREGTFRSCIRVGREAFGGGNASSRWV